MAASSSPSRFACRRASAAWARQARTAKSRVRSRRRSAAQPAGATAGPRATPLKWLRCRPRPCRYGTFLCPIRSYDRLEEQGCNALFSNRCPISRRCAPCLPDCLAMHLIIAIYIRRHACHTCTQSQTMSMPTGAVHGCRNSLRLCCIIGKSLGCMNLLDLVGQDTWNGIECHDTSRSSACV